MTEHHYVVLGRREKLQMCVQIECVWPTLAQLGGGFNGLFQLSVVSSLYPLSPQSINLFYAAPQQILAYSHISPYIYIIYIYIYIYIYSILYSPFPCTTQNNFSIFLLHLSLNHQSLPHKPLLNNHIRPHTPSPQCEVCLKIPITGGRPVWNTGTFPSGLRVVLACCEQSTWPAVI